MTVIAVVTRGLAKRDKIGTHHMERLNFGDPEWSGLEQQGSGDKDKPNAGLVGSSGLVDGRQGIPPVSSPDVSGNIPPVSPKLETSYPPFNLELVMLERSDDEDYPPDTGQASKRSDGQDKSFDDICRSEQTTTSGSEVDWDVLRSFDWRRDLSANGQKLYRLLLLEMGDVDLLPIFAEKHAFDLQSALDEIRVHGILDESHPEVLTLRKFPQ